MPEFSLEQVPAGRFDTVTAYSARHDGVQVMLLGVPRGAVGDYELQLRCETELPIDTLLARDAGWILSEFVSETPVKNKTFMDFSVELAHALVRRGIVGCTPIPPTDH
jgi:hypothetical protein